MLLWPWCSGHTIVRFHTLYINPAITEESPTPSNCPAGEVQVNVNSFPDHQLSLVPAKTGKASFQHGWTWTNPLSRTWKRSCILVSYHEGTWRHLKTLKAPKGTWRHFKNIYLGKWIGGNPKESEGTWRYQKYSEGTWRYLKAPKCTRRHLKAHAGTCRHLLAP